MDNKVCFVQKVIAKIDEHLATRDAHHGEYNKVARSPSVPEEYGVIARKFTPAGTFLGYYKGECIGSKEAESSLKESLSMRVNCFLVSLVIITVL